MANPALPSDERNRVEEQRLRHAAKRVADGKLQSRFVVPSMHCAGCMSKIERGLKSIPHIDDVRANLSTKSVAVTWLSDDGDAKDISDHLTRLGFTHFSDEEQPHDTSDRTGRQLLIALAVAGFAAANIMLLSVSVWSGADAETRHMFHLISGLIAVPAVTIAGRTFFSSAFKALRGGGVNMDVPISLAIMLAVGMSLVESVRGGPHAYFDASVMLLFFLLIGRYLDHLMRKNARGAVEQLSRMSAKGASVIAPDGSLDYVPLSDIVVGMTILVAAGERIPVDGVIISGSGDLDRSLVTGESNPVSADACHEVEAGTLSLNGVLKMRVSKKADQSFLAEVSQMMEAAEQGQSRFVRIADRFAALYAPAVHALALMTLVGWLAMSGGDITTSLYRAIAVLIITCPCALGLAVPIVHVIGANRLFRNGIMVKDGAAFEKLAAVDTVVFDKTGTLTVGKPEVTCMSGVTETNKVAAASLARLSNHPNARAVADALSLSVVDCDLEDIHEVPGCGISAHLDDREIRLGKAEWVAEISSGMPSSTHASATQVWFAMANENGVMFELCDKLRPDTRQTISDLLNSGISVEILSGDKSGPVTQVARQVGIVAFASEQSPHDKISRIEALKDEGRTVLMVGDGINDAPALAAAHVSIAPSSGSDIGRQAADLVFTGQSLTSIPQALHTARRIDALVRQNFGLALAYNVLAVPLAVFGYVTPLVAAIAMSSSSLLVVANSMRLQMAPLFVSQGGDATRSTVERKDALRQEAPA